MISIIARVMHNGLGYDFVVESSAGLFRLEISRWFILLFWCGTKPQWII